MLYDAHWLRLHTPKIDYSLVFHGKVLMIKSQYSKMVRIAQSALGFISHVVDDTFAILI